MKSANGFIILAIQALILWLFQYYLSPTLLYASAFGTSQTPHFVHWLAYIPGILLIGYFVPTVYRGYFYFLAVLVTLQNVFLALTIITLSALFFTATKFRKESKTASVLLYLFVCGGVASSGFLFLRNSSPWMWLWLMIHVTWGLKMLAWVTSVRIYKYSFSYKDFLDYFFNPVFFFFTNDLNVLTPKRFLDSAVHKPRKNQKLGECLLLLLNGLLLLVAYGVLQRYYFMNLPQVGGWSHSIIGGLISIVTAIVFHAANVFIQISLLRAQGYDLVVDMDKPWLASSPMDYWKRMHFYVREYIFEIIVRPVLTTMLRYQKSTRLIKILSVVLLYFLFTCTQLGYQPFRQDRPWQVGFLVTGVFMAMIIVPEYLSRQVQFEVFFKHKYWGRVLTFAILWIGYSLIFSFRSGF